MTQSPPEQPGLASPMAGALDRARRWALVLGKFALLQAVAQLFGLIAGIIVVRSLAKQDYAFYTIANGMLSTLVVLADGGMGTAMAGIAGRVWQDPLGLGRVVRTTLRYRARLRNLAGIPAALSLFWLLDHNGASWWKILTLTAATLLGASLSLDGRVYVVVPRLMSQVRLLQWIDAGSAAIRLVVVGLLRALGFLSSRTAILAVAVAYGYSYFVLRRRARRHIVADAPVSPEVHDELTGVLSRYLPNALYFAFQGQLSIWLLSIFGSADHVAELGALNRILVVYGVLMAAVEGVVLPRYARCQDKQQLWALFCQIWIGFVLVTLAPVVLVLVAPEPVLWVLGPKYQGLEWELLLATISAALGSINGLAWTINASRVWLLSPWLGVPAALIAQVVGMLVIGVATVPEVLLVQIVSTAIQIALNFALSLRRFRAGPIDSRAQEPVAAPPIDGSQG